MVLTVSSEQARQKKRWWDGSYMGLKGNYVYDYFGRDLAGALADQPPNREVRWPQAFFVEQEANSTLPAHFHMVDQFQVLFGGGGKIGRLPMERFGVHYTNAFTSYGPIHAGEEGFNYFTLRNSWDGSGAHRMPESRAKLLRETRRHLTLSPPGPRSPEELRGLREISKVELHALEPDGLGVWLHSLPPNATLTGADPADGAGQYWIVVGGSLTDAALDTMSCLFLTEADAALEVAAGPGGLEILAMQFPKRDRSEERLMPVEA